MQHWKAYNKSERLYSLIKRQENQYNNRARANRFVWMETGWAIVHFSLLSSPSCGWALRTDRQKSRALLRIESYERFSFVPRREAWDVVFPSRLVSQGCHLIPLFSFLSCSSICSRCCFCLVFFSANGLLFSWFFPPREFFDITLLLLLLRNRPVFVWFLRSS